MKLNRSYYIILALLSVMAIVFGACQPLQPPAPEAEGPKLATASATTQLTNQPGRAIVSARGNHFIVDSVPPLEGPNEELNPLDMMLSALATCGLFVAERAAEELEIPLTDAIVNVEGDLDPSGDVRSGSDPRIQMFRVHMDLEGAEAEQTAALVENFMTRCPIYTTLSAAADIEVTTGEEEMSAPIEGLATGKVTAQLSNQPGRAIVSARGNHFVIDSVPTLAGPNEERNPMDLMLGSLGTCGTFIFERAAQELDIPLSSVTTTVEADFDPSAGADPRIQAVRVNIEAGGIDDAQALALTEAFQSRCPIYTTVSRSTSVEITVVGS